MYYFVAWILFVFISFMGIWYLVSQGDKNMRDCEHCIHHKPDGCEVWDCDWPEGMTRQEAIRRLEIIKESLTKDNRRALEIAINSLKDYLGMEGMPVADNDSDLKHDVSV